MSISTALKDEIHALGLKLECNKFEVDRCERELRICSDEQGSIRGEYGTRRSLKAKSSRAPRRDAVSVQCSLSVRQLLTLLPSMIAWLNDFHRVFKFLCTIELTNLSRNITSMRAILS